MKKRLSNNRKKILGFRNMQEKLENLNTGTPEFSDLPTALSCKVKKSYTYGSKHFLAPFYKGPTNASKISFKYSGIESEAKKCNLMHHDEEK